MNSYVVSHKIYTSYKNYIPTIYINALKCNLSIEQVMLLLIEHSPHNIKSETTIEFISTVKQWIIK